MSHPDLTAVITADIPPTAKLLYAALYARTNGALTGAIPVADLCRELDGISEKTLRNLRTTLAPWAITATERGVVLFWLTAADSALPSNPATRDYTEVGRDSTAVAPNAPSAPLPSNPATRDYTEVGRDYTEAAPPTPPEEEECVNLPGTETTPPPLSPPMPAEQTRAFDLLTDPAIAMSWGKARTCQTAPFPACLAHVLAWQTENADRARNRQRPLNAGALAHRIQHFPAPALAWTADQLDLVRRHAPELLAPVEDEAEAQAESQPQPQPSPWTCTTAVPCADATREAHEVWTQAVAQLRLQMTKSTFETWLRDTRCQGYADGAFVVAVPSTYARDWLALRLRPTIKRTLTAIVGHAVDVSFEVTADGGE